MAVQSDVMAGSSSPSASRRRSGAVVGALMGNFLSLQQTVINVFGVLLVSIATEFRWSRAEAAGGFVAMSLASAAMLPIAGGLADRFSVRRVLVVGSALFGLSILLLSLAPSQPVIFYALFALVGATGAVPGNMLFSKLLSEWFDKDRGFWLGLTGGAGNGLGAVVMPAAAAILLHNYGWRGTYLGIGALVLGVGVPFAIATFHEPTERLNTGASGGELGGLTLAQTFRRPIFWLVLLTVPVGGGALTAVFANMMPILTGRGLAPPQAVSVIAGFALICVLWEPLIGFVLDRSDRPRRAAPVFLCAALGLLVLMKAHGFAALTCGAVMTGIGLGTEFSVLPLLLSRYFGLRSMGAIAGVAFASALISGALTPLALNSVFDVTGSYNLALGVVAVMMLLNGVAFALMARYPPPWATPALTA